jgi:DedD protein
LKMSNTDDAQLQKKARHRLVGAVVFVAIAASLLIWAMDPEPPDTPAPTLIIPLEDGTEVLPLDGNLALSQTSPAPESAPPLPEHAPPLATQLPPPAAADRAEPPRPASVTSATPAAATVAPKPAQAQAPVPAQAPAPAAKPAAVANPALQDANRAAAILAGRSPEITNPGASQPAANAISYVVQVIASSNRDTVRDAVEKLRALKLPVYTEGASGNMTRVRVGPYSTRTEAEKAEEKINQDGKIVGTKIYPQAPS